MDSLISAAARALRAGDPLGALKRVALRDDPAALALRGVAMAQLGELGPAKQLLQRAARAFGPREALSRARCATAEAEVALAARDLGFPTRALDLAVATFEAHGDLGNAAHARLLGARRSLLLGRIDDAEGALSRLDLGAAPPMLTAIAELCAFDLALRRGRAGLAHDAIDRASRAADRARIPVLSAEIERAARALREPTARLIASGEPRLVLLDEVERVRASGLLVVDAGRRAVSVARDVVRLARRPVLFSLLRALAEAWPSERSRDALVSAAFGARRASESLRARLRVEIGRLRVELRALAEIHATPGGFVLAPRAAPEVAVLAPPIEGADAALLALLADGAAWSTSALALALGSSQRTVQRALAALERAGHVRALGRGRAARWIAPPTIGFTTAMLLSMEPTID